MVISLIIKLLDSIIELVTYRHSYLDNINFLIKYQNNTIIENSINQKELINKWLFVSICKDTSRIINYIQLDLKPNKNLNNGINKIVEINYPTSSPTSSPNSLTNPTSSIIKLIEY